MHKKMVAKIIVGFLLLISISAYADSFTVIWDPVTTGVDGQPVVGLQGYKVYAAPTPGGYGATPIAVTASNTTTITITTLGRHYLVVRAYNAAGESANSDEVSVQVKAKIPDAPNQFRVVP